MTPLRKRVESAQLGSIGQYYKTAGVVITEVYASKYMCIQ